MATVRWAWLAGLLALLVGCGGGGAGGGAGGGGDDPPPTTASATVTAAEGGELRLPLAGGGEALLLFPPEAVASDTPVKVSALPTSGGEWLRLRIEPGIQTLGAAPLLRVRPPRAVEAAQVPVLQIVGADGAATLRTAQRADGGLEAALPPPLAAELRAAPAAARTRALAAPRAQAGAQAGATTVSGVGFLAVCRAPQAAVDDALRVIDNASSGSAVLAAVSALAMLEDRCAGPGVLDEAQLDHTRRVLEELGAGLPRRYRDAMAAWKAVDYGAVETQTVPLERGVRRLLALCAAAQDLAAPLTCPVPSDYEPEYTELANGFYAASGEREHQGGLRLLLDPLRALLPEAALFGFSQAEPALREAIARIADRLMDRAYALCSHGELFEWRAWADFGAPTGRTSQAIASAMAHCDLRLTAQRITVDEQGVEQRGDAQTYEPGTLAGDGRIDARTLTLPFDARLLITASGPTTRCSRVIGTPDVAESLSLRVAGQVVGSLGLARRFDPQTPSEARFDLARLLRDIGRAEGSTDPVVIEVWRPAVGPIACTDSGGGTLALQTEETRVATLTVQPPDRALRVRVLAPPAVAVRAAVAVEVHAQQTDGSWLPQPGATVTLDLTGGSAPRGLTGVTGTTGRAVVEVVPVPGHATVEVVARTRVDGIAGSGGATMRIGSMRWTGHLEYLGRGESQTRTTFDPSVADSSYAQSSRSLAIPRTEITATGNPWESYGLQIGMESFPGATWGFSSASTSQTVLAWTEECRVIRSERRYTDYKVDPTAVYQGRILNPMVVVDAVLSHPDAEGRFAYRVDLGQMQGRVTYERVDTDLRSPVAGPHCTSESALEPPKIRYWEGPLQQTVRQAYTRLADLPNINPTLRFDLPPQRYDAEIVIEVEALGVAIDEATRTGTVDRRVFLRLRPELP
jgi:hypothetical protein